ncbi:uncharacterized protein LOC133191074 [Saccostrea echinata]|uniref:uncharacterized protein LOC133191074 n=1 Tax=Saccostrea echinata TaxID=191078 RepID=UPI002A83C047|nr:uncharacterized protein LOC133191074 [Saccostrea echinata]
MWKLLILLLLGLGDVTVSVSVQPGLETPLDVIVVGGGIAGMAAARKLTNTPEKYSVKVLEACKNRYGGRVYTDRKGSVRGVEGDLGASFLNSGVPNNPLLELTKSLEIAVESTGFVQLYAPSQNKVFTPEETTHVFSELLSVVRKAVEKAFIKGDDRPLPEAVKEELSSFDTDVDKSVLAGLVSSHYALSERNFSTAMFRPEKDFGWNKVVVDGFDQIVDGIVSGEGTEFPILVELEAIVRHITYDKRTKKYKVRTFNREQYEADIVIVAVPLGILQKGEIVFGEPQKKSTSSVANMPDTWHDTIRNKLGVSFSNKLVVEFDDIFWPPDVGVFTMATDNEKEAGILQTWINLHRLINKPVLMGSIGGPIAQTFESWTDDEVKSKVKANLEKFFGAQVQNRTIKRIKRSAWQENENSGGALTFPRVGTTAEQLKILSEPRCPGLYFAGEYTIVEHMNTAHGAYMSGIRAAEQVMSGYCQQREEEKKKTEKKKRKKSEKREEEEEEDTDSEEEKEVPVKPKKSKERIILSEERRKKAQERDEL